VLTFAYILYALAQAALAVWAYRVYRATPNAGTLTLVLSQPFPPRSQGSSSATQARSSRPRRS